MHLSLSAKLKKSLFHEYKCLWLYQENLLIYLFIAGKGSVCASRILYPRDSPRNNAGVSWDLSDPGIETVSLVLAGGSFTH